MSMNLLISERNGSCIPYAICWTVSLPPVPSYILVSLSFQKTCEKNPWWLLKKNKNTNIIRARLVFPWRLISSVYLLQILGYQILGVLLQVAITDLYIFLHCMLFHFPDTSGFMPHAFFTQFEDISNTTNYWILLNCITLTQFYGFP